MKQKLHLWIIPVFLLCVIMFYMGCKGLPPSPTSSSTPTTGTIIFDNKTGQRLRAYIDGSFMDFVEIGQQRSFANNPAGQHELKADNFGDGVWGPVRIDLPAGGTYTWILY